MKYQNILSFSYHYERFRSQATNEYLIHYCINQYKVIDEILKLDIMFKGDQNPEGYIKSPGEMKGNFCMSSAKNWASHAKCNLF